MASNLLSFAGWYFLPNLATGYAQSFLYTLLIRAGDPKPAPGSPRFVRDRRRIFTLVILAYLIYTVVEADYQLRLTGDFYKLLGVPHNVDERALQSHFRRLTVQFHPDKVSSGADRSAVEALYVNLKLARDVLVDPVRRFAYDRLGPEILQWQQCRTIRDFVLTGVRNTAVYYGVSGAVLFLLGLVGYLETGKFWRYLVMASLFVVELHAMTQPAFPALLTRVVNPLLAATRLRQPYLPFQMLLLLRKLAITFFIALSQLGPVLQDSQQAGQGGAAVLPQQLDRIEALTAVADQEVSRLMGLELMPFSSDQATLQALRTTLKEWLVQNTVRNDAEVKAAISSVLDRRRRGARLDDHEQPR